MGIYIQGIPPPSPPHIQPRVTFHCTMSDTKRLKLDTSSSKPSVENTYDPTAVWDVTIEYCMYVLYMHTNLVSTARCRESVLRFEISGTIPATRVDQAKALHVIAQYSRCSMHVCRNFCSREYVYRVNLPTDRRVVCSCIVQYIHVERHFSIASHVRSLCRIDRRIPHVMHRPTVYCTYDTRT